MNSKSARVRDSSLDLLCGILISYMIIYHAYIWCPITKSIIIEIFDKIFFFFMPWFYYKSGMFNKKESTKEIAITNTKKLLFPFIIYTVMGEIVLWLCINLRNEGEFDIIKYLVSSLKCLIIQGSTIGNQPLWFLVSLYITKVFFSFLRNKNIPTTIILLLSFIAGWISSYTGAYINGRFLIPYLFMSSTIGITFYGLGTLLHRIQYTKVVFFVASIIYISIILLLPSQVDVRLNMLKQGSWIAFMVSSLAGIIVANNLARLKILQFPFLISIGNNSLSYYCFHWILFYLTTTICGNFNSDNYYLLTVLYIVSTFFLPIYAYWVWLLKKHSSPNHKLYL